MPEQYVQEMRVRVTMGDVDANRIHFSAYYRYMDRNAGELYAAVGHPTSAVIAEGLGMPVVQSSCRYEQPVHLDDELLVRTRIAAVGRTSFTEGHEFLKLPSRERVAEGQIVHVMIDLRTGQALPVPDWIRALAEGPSSSASQRAALDGSG